MVAILKGLRTIYTSLMKQILCLLVVVALSGCDLPPPGFEPSPEVQARRQASRECDYEARVATAQITDGIVARRKQDVLFEACMEARGYEW
jgi:hypothetical protein